MFFPTPEYFPSSGGLYDCILLDIWSCGGFWGALWLQILTSTTLTPPPTKNLSKPSVGGLSEREYCRLQPTARHKELQPTNCTATNRCTRPTASDQATDALRTRWYASSDFGQSCFFSNNQFWESKSSQRNIVLLLVNCEYLWWWCWWKDSCFAPNCYKTRTSDRLASSYLMPITGFIK